MLRAAAVSGALVTCCAALVDAVAAFKSDKAKIARRASDDQQQ